jgi:hypothetical protein
VGCRAECVGEVIVVLKFCGAESFEVAVHFSSGARRQVKRRILETASTPTSLRKVGSVVSALKHDHLLPHDAINIFWIFFSASIDSTRPYNQHQLLLTMAHSPLKSPAPLSANKLAVAKAKALTVLNKKPPTPAASTPASASGNEAPPTDLADQLNLEERKKYVKGQIITPNLYEELN